MFKSLLAVCLMASAVVAQEVRLSSSSDLLFALPQQSHPSTVLDVPTKAPVSSSVLTVEDPPVQSILGVVSNAPVCVDGQCTIPQQSYYQPIPQTVAMTSHTTVSNECTCTDCQCAANAQAQVVHHSTVHTVRGPVRGVFANRPVRSFFAQRPVRSFVGRLFGGCR